MNVTQTHSKSNRLIHSITFLPKKTASVKGSENFIHDDNTVGCGLFQNSVNSDQVILKFAPEILDVLLLV